MNIGIDIDDTISNSSEIFIKYAKIYNKENYINFKINTNELNQEKAFGWNEYHQKIFSKKFLNKILNETKPKKNAVSIINRLKGNGNKIIIITARSNSELRNIYDITENWLKIYNINFDKLIVDSQSKELDCIKNNIDIFIDDNYKICEKVNEKANIPVFLFNTRYNSNCKSLNVERVFNWNEIYMKINNIKLGVNDEK